MELEEFKRQLDLAYDLMSEENYKEAIIRLEKLVEIDKKSDFNYGHTHRLHQLYSNAKSLYNQQEILKCINSMTSKQKALTFKELGTIIRDNSEIDIDDTIVRKEVELLVLRQKLNCRIHEDSLVFD